MRKSPFKIKMPFKAMGDQPAAIDALSKNLIKGEKFQTLLGVTGSGKTFTMANVIQKVGKKTLILAPNKTLAAQLFSEFRYFFPDNAVEYFVSFYDFYQPEAYVPGSDTYIEKDSAINDEIDKLRHSATRSLLSRDDVIVVASVSCIYGIGEPDEYYNQRLTLFKGDKIERDAFLRKLVEAQYQRNDIDFKRGTFRVRGDIVEVFPAYEESQVVRIEFFDEIIDSISIVDPLLGKVIQSISRVDIFPKSHYVVGSAKMKSAVEDIKLELRDRLQQLDKENKLVEAQRLKQRTLLDLEMMEEMGFCPGIENYSRHLSGSKPGSPPSTLIDYFKKDFLLIVDESHIAIPQIGGMFKGDRSRKQTLVDYGFRLPSALDNRPLNFEEFEAKLDQTIFVSATPAKYEMEKNNGDFVEQIIRPTGLLDPIIEFRDSNRQVDDMLVESKKVIKQGFRVLVTTLTKKLAEELTSFYTSAGLKVKYLHSDIDTLERMEIIRDLRLGEFDILVGINLLREGLDIPEVALVGILDADKEGFLRNTRSLIQTIGRAARNSNGKVYLYGLKKTPSIVDAMTITDLRRKKQHEFNIKNGITPITIIKNVSGGVIDVLRGNKKTKKKEKLVITDETISPEQIDAKIIEFKKLMKDASRNLDFEEAARLRDEVKKLTELRFML